jgi:4-hydroxy-4-methyl-2-oxoglutarate aldolase
MTEQILAFGSATVAKALGRPCWVGEQIRPVWRGARLAGPAFTARTTAPDNLALHRALEGANRGDVLVVDAGGIAAGFWGEIMSVAALERGLAGLVIDGGVRDIDRIEQLGFPVFARWVAIAETAKVAPGEINVSVVIGGLSVAPGDMVLADADAVVVVPSAELPGALALSREIEAREAEALKRIRNGESTIQVLGLRKDRDGEV